MRINRSSNVHIKLPEEVLSKGEGHEAKATISFNLVIPKTFSEKRMQNFMSDQVEKFNKAFKKAIKKELEKLEDEE